MIPCSKCGNVNPLSTRFCRVCGAKIEVTYSEVAASVSASAAERQSKDFLTHGLNAVTVGGFLLIAAMVVWFGLAPAEPAAEPPLSLPESLVPRESAGAAATALGNVAITSTRLVSRAVLAPVTVSRIGADPGTVAGWIKTVCGSIRDDGSCAVGDDQVAATALAALALQALPTEDGLTKATKARAWLQGQMKDLGRRSSLARSLTLLTLIDAEELTSAQRIVVFPYLIDGKAPAWQAWAYALANPKDRPKEDILVRKALTDPRWTAIYAMLEGKDHGLAARDFMSETATTVTTGEDRMLWAFLAWHTALAPGDLRKVMAAWTQGRPAEVEAGLAKACGPHAALCVGLLTVGAPLRVPVGWATPPE